MQNRYTGDIGDFAKYGLLRALAPGLKLGVAWYLYPDEDHNRDGRHTGYLKNPEKWRRYDPELFDSLIVIADAMPRCVGLVERSGLLGGTTVFARAKLDFKRNPGMRARERAAWFRTVQCELADCDLVFADPDNGLRDDSKYQMQTPTDWKSIPLSEANVLATGRTAIIYHHNTRAKGGHAAEIERWMERLGPETLALYWRRFSNRTFFIVHPTDEIARRARLVARCWAPHFELFPRGMSLKRAESSTMGVRCPGLEANPRADPRRPT